MGLVLQIFACFLIWRYEQRKGTVNFFIKTLIDSINLSLIHMLISLIVFYGFKRNDGFLFLCNLFPIWLLNFSSHCFEDPKRKISLILTPGGLPAWICPFIVVMLNIVTSQQVFFSDFTCLLYGFLDSRFGRKLDYLLLSRKTVYKISKMLEIFSCFCTIFINCEDDECLNKIKEEEGKIPGGILAKKTTVGGKNLTKEEIRKSWLEKHGQKDMKEEVTDIEIGIKVVGEKVELPTNPVLDDSCNRKKGLIKE